MQGECRACPCAKARTPGPNPSLSWADWGQSSIGESPVCRHGTQSLSPHEERLPCHLICSSTGWGRGGPGDRALCCEVQEEIGLCGAKIQTWEHPRHAPSTSGPHETQAWNPWACDFSGGLSRGRVHRCPLKLRWHEQAVVRLQAVVMYFCLSRATVPELDQFSTPDEE